MEKRTVKFGSYDTAAYGWTLTGYKLSDAEQKTNYVEKPGGDGSWDMSTTLTDGIPRYKDRSLTVTLECSEGTRADRQELISHMINLLDGLVWDTVLPDYPEYYVTGRLHVAVDQNSLAYAAITVTGTVAPWLYRIRDTVIELPTTVTVENGGSLSNLQEVPLSNSGRLAVVPRFTVTSNPGAAAVARFQFGNTAAFSVQAGEYKFTNVVLTPGRHTLSYGCVAGTVTIAYREAVLA